MAAKRTAAGEHGNVRFAIAPALQWIFGASPSGAIDSRELVDYSLRFINGDESSVEPDPVQVADQPFMQKGALGKTRESWRASLRQFAATFRGSRARALRSLPEYSLGFHSVSAMAKWEPTSAHLEFFVPVSSPEALRTAFALALADDAQPFGRALCRCRLTSCGRFFLEQKPATGRPQRLYCSRDHMLAAHAARER